MINPVPHQRIGLIFATAREAEPFLEISRAVSLDDPVFTLYDIDPEMPVRVAVSGMGKIAAAAACQYLICEYGINHVVNAGVCGALKTGENFQPGRMFRITAAVEGDHGTEAHAAPEVRCPTVWAAQLPAARLVTCDRPVFENRRRRELASQADLVDMEGAAVARVAELFSIPWTLIKAVTDGAGPSDRPTLLNNLAAVSTTLARFLWSYITTNGIPHGTDTI